MLLRGKGRSLGILIPEGDIAAFSFVPSQLTIPRNVPFPSDEAVPADIIPEGEGSGGASRSPSGREEREELFVPLFFCSAGGSTACMSHRRFESSIYSVE
jgi:hypothetical protein